MFISKRNWDWIVWTLEIFIDAIEEEFKLEIPDIEADKIGKNKKVLKKQQDLTPQGPTSRFLYKSNA
ncbi:unnamed protein product [Brassica oleracea var. botrytis]